MKEETLQIGDFVAADDNGNIFKATVNSGYTIVGCVLQTEPELHVMALQHGRPAGIWRVEKARKRKEPTRWQKLLAEAEGIPELYKASLPSFKVDWELDPIKELEEAQKPSK